MTKTREQLEGEAALARLQRALDGTALDRLQRVLQGKPREDDRTFDMPSWLADLMRDRNARSDER